MRRRSIIWSVSFAALGLLLLSCKSSGPARRYDLTGKIVSADSKTKKVEIAHEDVPGYMPAMTMQFTVNEAWVYDAATPGARITATLVIDGTRSWLEDVVITQGEPEPGATTRGGPGPKPGDEIPDFQLVNQDGKRIRTREYRGNALLITFIYTRCPLPDYCPLMTSNFSEIQAALRSRPDLYNRTKLLSITVDPEYDRPAVLRNYGSRHTEGFNHWEFAGGAAAEIKAIAGYFGMRYWEEGDQIIHSLTTAVIDPDGKLFKLYTGNEWKPADVVGDLGLLFDGRSRPASSL
jgi:protein SCO1/2